MEHGLHIYLFRTWKEFVVVCCMHLAPTDKSRAVYVNSMLAAYVLNILCYFCSSRLTCTFSLNNRKSLCALAAQEETEMRPTYFSLFNDSDWLQSHLHWCSYCLLVIHLRVAHAVENDEALCHTMINQKVHQLRCTIRTGWDNVLFLVTSCNIRSYSLRAVQNITLVMVSKRWIRSFRLEHWPPTSNIYTLTVRK